MYINSSSSFYTCLWSTDFIPVHFFQRYFSLVLLVDQATDPDNLDDRWDCIQDFYQLVNQEADGSVQSINHKFSWWSATRRLEASCSVKRRTNLSIPFSLRGDFYEYLQTIKMELSISFLISTWAEVSSRGTRTLQAAWMQCKELLTSSNQAHHKPLFFGWTETLLTHY